MDCVNRDKVSEAKEVEMINLLYVRIKMYLSLNTIVGISFRFLLSHIYESYGDRKIVRNDVFEEISRFEVFRVQ